VIRKRSTRKNGRRRRGKRSERRERWERGILKTSWRSFELFFLNLELNLDFFFFFDCFGSNLTGGCPSETGAGNWGWFD
jgi:hypothetical protein